MRDQDIKDLLHDVDEETAVQLGEEFPAVTPEKQEQLYSRLQERMGSADTIIEITSESRETAEYPRFEWVRRYGAAAACFAVCAGTMAGLFWLNGHAPTKPIQDMESSPTAASDAGSVADDHPVQHGTARAVRIGDTFEADNLTETGACSVKVASAEWNDGGLTLKVELTSRGTSLASDPALYFVDNFLLMNGKQTISPDAFEIDGEMGEPTGSFLLPENTSRTLTLHYQVGEGKAVWKFTTGCSPDLPYVLIS